MSTLIAVYTSDGCEGRCDSKCYDADPSSECFCICGGRNHGAGKQQAVQNTRELAEEWVELYAKEHHLTDYQTKIPARRPIQLALPIGEAILC